MRKVKLIFVLIILAKFSMAQELNARVSVISNRVGNNVNQNVFRTLQSALNIFVNNRKWTPDTYLPNEKIECSFLLNLEPSGDLNVYNHKKVIADAKGHFGKGITTQGCYQHQVGPTAQHYMVGPGIIFGKIGQYFVP